MRMGEEMISVPQKNLHHSTLCAHRPCDKRKVERLSGKLAETGGGCPGGWCQQQQQRRWWRHCAAQRSAALHDDAAEGPPWDQDSMMCMVENETRTGLDWPPLHPEARRPLWGWGGRGAYLPGGVELDMCRCTFCHLLSLRCQIRVSSDCLVTGMPVLSMH